jgi:2'-5' RNA ligase
MEQIRSFIAIELPDELKKELGELVARLKMGNQSWVKWVDPYSIHLTLKFLGNVAANRIAEIIKVMEVASQGITSFQLELSGLGVFPNLRRVQVAWVGVKGDLAKLQQLQQRIDSGLVPLGFATESRKFTPHLTLARLRNQSSLGERQRFGELITSTSFTAIHSIEVVSISLMRSQLTREGAIYSRIGSVALK